MIETKHDQMTDQQIEEHLCDSRPEFSRMQCNISLLKSKGVTVQSIRHEISRTALEVNAEYKGAWREHLSIYQDVEDNMANRQLFFERKKRADEAKELSDLRNQLKHFRIITSLGERIDINTLTLPQLRKHAATVATNRRQQAMTADEIRAEEAAKTPKDTRRHPPYADLPLEITANELNRLLRGPDARRLLRKHGAENLNDRLYGRG
jgi:hypothetical protein